VLRAVVALLLVVVSSHAEAGGRFDAGAGECEHTGFDEGIWWQSQFGYDGGKRARCVEVQWQQEGDKGLTLGLVHLGYLHSQSLATINDTTEFLKTYTGGPCESPSARNCRVVVHTLTSEWGATLGGFYASGAFAAEGGILAYRSHFKANVQLVDAGAPFPAEHTENVVGYHYTPYLGAVARWRRLYLRLRVYQKITQDGRLHNGSQQFGFAPDGTPQRGLTAGPLYAITAGVSF
jgi:hypothetical protein